VTPALLVKSLIPPRDLRIMGSGRTREVASDLMIQALKQSLTVEKAAGLIGCSAPLIHHRAKEDKDVAVAVSKQGRDKDEALATAISSYKGILSKVAPAVGLDSAASVRYHIGRNPYLQQVLQDSREGIVDKAEENVFEAVEQGSVDDSWKLLKTLGKNRGYAERREVESTVTTTSVEAKTSDLVAILDRLAQLNPTAVEAEFEVIPDEDREVLARALKEHSVDSVA